MIAYKYTVFCVITCFVRFAGNAAAEIATEKKLRNDLLANYDKMAMPEDYTIYLQLYPTAFVELNEKTSTLIFDAALGQMWTDERLRWNYEDYEGITDVKFDINEIWHTNLYVLNSRPSTYNSPWIKSHVMVFYSGNVYYYPPSTFYTRCVRGFSSDIDKRICNITIGEDIVANSKIKLKIFEENSVSTEFLTNDHIVWEITNISSSIQNYTINPDTNNMKYIITVKLKKRDDFTEYIKMGPKIVAILLSMSMFCLPPNSYRKINLGCLSLLLLSAVMIYLSSTVASPMNLSITVAPVGAVLLTVVSALLIEIAILNLPRLCDILKPPAIVLQVLSGMVGRVIGICPIQQYKSEEVTNDQALHDQSFSVEQQWIVIAMTLDRCFFIIYLIIFCII